MPDNYIQNHLALKALFQSQKPAKSPSSSVLTVPQIPYLSDPEQQDKINSFLLPFGARLPQPQEIKQNFLLPEAGTDNFFGAHPSLTRGIEGGLLAAATTHSGNTIGENISNVAQSVLGIPALRQQHIASEMMAPFGIASQVAQLQNAADMHGVHQAQMNDFNAQAALRNRPPVAKYNNIQKDADGNLWGQNETSGQIERVPLNLGGMMAPDFSKPDKPTTLADSIIEGQAGPKPIKTAGESDAAFQSRYKTWAQTASKFQIQPKLQVAVAGAEARNGSRYGTFFDPTDFSIRNMTQDEAYDKRLTPVASENVEKMMKTIVPIKGLENAVNSVEQNLDVLKDPSERLALTAALHKANSDPGYLASIIQGTARSNLSPKATQLAVSILRARELSGGLRANSGGMVGSIAMLNNFISGSIPSGSDPYNFAAQMIKGTRKEINIVKQGTFSNLSGVNLMDSVDANNAAAGNGLASPNVMAPPPTGKVFGANGNGSVMSPPLDPADAYLQKKKASRGR